MTLIEMADLVCEKVNKTDDDSLALCKKFIRRRYQLIYDSYLWKDSLDIAEGVTNGASEYGWSNKAVMPRWMERVIAVRVGDSTRLSVEEQSLFFQKDPSFIDRAGTVGGVSAFQQIRPYFWYERFGQDYLYFRSVLGGDNGKKVYITDDESGTLRSAELVDTYENSFDLVDMDVDTIRFTKDAMSGDIILWGSGDDEVIVSGPDTSLRYERIRLLEDPGESVELMVLGKRRVRNLVNDSDAPIIQNIDDAIIAHAQADMLERARQYAKAAEKRQEANAQVAKAIDLETNQSARVVVICPASYHDISNGDDI